MAKGDLFVFYPSDDRVAAEHARFIVEGGKTWDIDKKWSVRYDPPHHPQMQYHTHVMLRGNDVAIINRDGSPSHGTSRDNVPGWVLTNIKKQQLIENRLLVEAAFSDLQLNAGIIARAERHAKIRGILSQIILDRRR